jgi:hypothetical protein
MKAKLVTFVLKTRVIIPDDATEDDVIKMAVQNCSADCDALRENVDEITDDTECPYDSQYDK